MKNFIIGTAGHVDHGKTSLIKSLTGRDTDRLQEEKKRGITIELGFTYIDLPHFPRTGIIDVPGHEKFIRNMLMGSGGIDYAMLVVAADESVMKQTKEHLEILNLVGVKNGIVVITKKDLATDEMINICKEDIKNLVKGTFLENSKIAVVSTKTGEGIDELKNTLDEELLKLQDKDIKEDFRYCVDRSFTLQGIGTVVTGTVLNGSIDLNTEVYLYPSATPLKIRSLQVHGENVEKAYAGERLAINITNLKKEEIERGDIIAKKDSLTITKLLDCKIKLLPDSEFNLKNNSRVHFYLSSRSDIAKVVLIGIEELKKGEETYAQLRFTKDVVAKKNDHFVIRFFSPEVTIGGGVVLDKDPIKKKHKNLSAAENIKLREIGSEKDQIYQVIIESKNNIYDIDTIASKVSMDKDTVNGAISKLLSDGKIFKITSKLDNKNYYISDVNEVRIAQFITNLLAEFHKENNLKEGMSKEAVRSQLLSEKGIVRADEIISHFINKKIIKENNSYISLYNFSINAIGSEDKTTKEIEDIFKNYGLELPVLNVVYEELEKKYKNNNFRKNITYLLNNKILIKIDDKYILHKDNLDMAINKINEFGRDKKIILGEFRDYMGISRKVALALLDYFDKKGITIKNGDERVLRKK